MSSVDDNPPTEEELYQIIKELEQQNEELQQEIANLQKNDVGRGRRRGGGQSDAILEEELRQLREKNDADQGIITKLREDLSNANLKLTKVTEEKNDLDRKLRVQTKRLEELEKENDNNMRKSQQAEKQNREVHKMKSENIKMTQQLSDENAKLQEEKKELEAQLQQLFAEKAELEEAITILAEQKEEIEAQRDSLDAEASQQQLTIQELERDLDDMQEKLKASVEAELDWEKRYQQLQQDLAAFKTQAIVDQKSLKIENEKLQLDLVQLKSSTNIGRVQKQADDLKAELAKAQELITELEQAYQDMEEQKNTLALELEEYHTNLDQKIVDKVTFEKSQSKQLELAVDQLKQKLTADQDYYRSVEEEKLLLTKEIDELKHWKAVYEAGHALTALAKEKKRLQDDNRRLSTEIEKHMTQIGILSDANNKLSLSFEKLKKETGKPANFYYPEFELQEEAQSSLTSLQYQLAAVEDQLHTVENDNIKLRKQVLENFSKVVTAKGFAYPGMTPEMLFKVNEFANNLRNGTAELPLNDKSKELAQEVMQLKMENKLLREGGGTGRRREKKAQRTAAPAAEKGSEKLPKELLEAAETVMGDQGLGEEGSREEGGLDYYDSLTEGGPGGILSDAFGADIKALLSENHLLQKKISDLQLQLDRLIHNSNQQVGSATPGLVRTEELAAIIAQNNELLLKEIEDVRRSHSSAPPPGGMGYHPMMTSDRSVPPDGPMMSGRLSGRPGSATAASQSRPPTGRSLRLNLQNEATAATPARPSTAGGMSMASTPHHYHSQHRPPAYYTPGPMTPGGMSQAQYSTAAGGPTTPHGKQLLNHTLFHMNLPPEEWAGEVKDIATQLIECLEQLYEREEDLEVQKALVKTFEENAAEMKVQMTVLYHDYAQRRKEWSEKEKTLLEEQRGLLAERDELKLRLKRSQDAIVLLQKEDKEAIETKCIDLTRKVTIYEVNESILSRKYIALQETLETETKRRLELTQDFIEMESLLKQRILYLEQYKLLASNRLGLLQTKLDASIPQDDYLTLELELESLREDHLNALRREVETRVNALKALEKDRENRQLKLMLLEYETEETKARTFIQQLHDDLVRQELLHQQSISVLEAKQTISPEASKNMSELISEMARARGEVTRLTVELSAANQKVTLLTANLTDATVQIDQLSNRVHELEVREQEYSKKESEARNQLVALKVTYEQGCTRDEKQELLEQLSTVNQKLDEQTRELRRCQEIADIAQHQAQSLQEMKLSFETEVKELRAYCSQLESRSEDELLIGRLQRQLISTKASYKGFVRKYHSTRENLRRREIAMRIIENKLSEVEKASSEDRDKAYVKLAALKRALKNIKDTIVQSTPNLLQTTINTPHHSDKGAEGGGQKTISVRANNAMGKNKYFTIGLGAKLVEISEKVETFATLAEDSVAKASQKEAESKTLLANIEDLTTEREILRQRVKDLETLTAANAKQQVIAARLVGLSEEVRLTKLKEHDQRRQLQTLREEIKHLRHLLQKQESEMQELERGKIELEVHKSMLFDQGSGLGRLRGGEEEVDYEEEEQLLREIDKIDPHRSLRESLDPNSDLNKSKKKPKTPRIDRQSLSPSLQRSLSRLSIDTSNGEGEEEGIYVNLTIEEYQAKLKQLTDQLSALRKEISESQLQRQALAGQMEDYSQLLAEKDNHIHYYERVLQEHGLQQVLLQERPRGRPGTVSASSAQMMTASQQYRILPEEQEQLQEVASATTRTMKQMLEEKNREIAKLRERLTLMSATPSSKSRAERRADDLLDEINQMQIRGGDGGSSRGGRDSPHSHSHSQDPVRKLQDQLEVADQMIQDKEQTVRQLETRLATELNARERAEERCGEALREIEAMKTDMMTLVQQLHDHNHRFGHLTSAVGERLSASLRGGTLPPAAPASNHKQQDSFDQQLAMEMEELRLQQQKLTKKKGELEKALKLKDEKLKSYREIIIKLKEEFIKVEEEKAAQELLQQRAGGKGSRSALDNGDYEAAAERITPEELRNLKERLNEFSSGFKEVKANLENSKRAREKLSQDNRLAKEEIIKLSEELQKKEEQLVQANNFVASCRRKLEDAARKEVRLKEQLREFKDLKDEKSGSTKTTGPAGAGAPKSMKEAYQKAREEITQLHHENQLLKAQLTALQPHHKSSQQHQEMLEKQFKEYSSQSGHLATPGQIAFEQQAKLGAEADQTADNREGVAMTLRGATGGYILGSGPNPANALEDYKQQLHQKWENEKKLQRKLGLLEKRVSELATDNEDLRSQLLKTRDHLQTAQHSKEEMQRKVTSSQRQVQESKKLTVHEISELDQAQARVFALEDELKLVKRKAEVDQANEIRLLQHQLSSCHARIKSLESELIESEVTRKELAAAVKSNSGPSSLRAALRESEDRALQQDKLREEAEFYKRRKLELEALLLQRDNKLLEFQFDLETRVEELNRLRRRNSEIELAFHTLQAVVASNAQLNANQHIPAGEGGGGRGGVSILTREEERLLSLPLTMIVGDGTGTGSRPGTSGGGGGGVVPAHIAASKREAELENVIDALKKVIGKLQGENERLKRGISSTPATATGGAATTAVVGDPARRLPEVEKKYQQEKKKHETLQAEHQVVLRRNQELTEMVEKLNQRQTQLSNLRNQLKLKENEIVVLSSEIAQYKRDLDQYQKKVKALEEKIQSLSLSQQTVPAAAAAVPQSETKYETNRGPDRENLGGTINKQLSQQIVENDLLKKELTELRKKLTLQTSEILYLREQYMTATAEAEEAKEGRGGKDSQRRGAGRSSETIDLMEINRLKEENQKLREELSAFDLEFFEEIENLKFAHAEAMRKLKHYESQYGPLRR